ncbi:MAG TPA: hypothetical protein VJV23_09215 [Candidatus Polarisedimenticolia bacterium]|nr:hypothetical protein [Candidatus Polarisedimenticolia bacterium]
MPASRPNPRVRSRSRRRKTDPYLVSLSTLAVSCVAVVLAMLAWRPTWETPLLGCRVGAYLLGGLGGILTIALLPRWHGRFGRETAPRRLVSVTLYRLAAACLLGAAGYGLGSVMSSAAMQSPHGWLPNAAALATGLAELGVSELLLRGLGVFGRGEPDARFG